MQRIWGLRPPWWRWLLREVGMGKQTRRDQSMKTADSSSETKPQITTFCFSKYFGAQLCVSYGISSNQGLDPGPQQ